MQRICASLLLFMLIAVTAHGQLELSFSSATVTSAGQDVEIDVVVEEGFDDILSMQFSLNWDASVFAFSSISNVTDVLPMFSEASNIGTPVSAAAVVDGQLTVSWSQTSTQPASIPDGTRLFTLVLTSVGQIGAGTTIELSNTPRIIEVVNNDFDILDLASIRGDLLIDDGSGGVNMDGVGLFIDDLDAPAGGQVCVPITATDFTDIEGLTFGLEWDPNVLSFDPENGVRGIGISPINVNANRADEGELNALWFLETVPVTVPDGEVLFEICFNVIGSTGETTEINIVDLPNASPPVEIDIVSNGMSLEFFTDNATFTVGSGDTGGNRDGVGFIGEDIFTGDATSICIPILTENFDSLVAFMTGVSFDPSVLSFTGFNTTGLNNVQVASQDANDGLLRVLWTDSNANPVTLPDGTSLLELCFDIIGAEGTSSPIGFVNIPPNFTIEAIRFPSNSTPFFIEDGLINIGNENEPTMDENVVLTASNNTFNLNEEVCVQFTVENFTNIAGMSFVIGWDQNVLEYIEPRNTNLAGLSTGGANFVFIEPNSLRVLYTPTSSQSVADGTVIFEVCYRALAACDSGAASDITLGSDGNISVEFIDGNSQLLPVTLNNGRVSAATCPMMMEDDDVTLLASDEVINVGQTVCVDFNVNGFNNITEFSFGLDWDESVLQFLEVRSLNIPGLSPGEPNFIFDSPDGLRVSYNANSPLSLANNTRIFEVCYNVLDCNEGGTSQIAVGTNSGANLRFENSSGTALTVVTNNVTLTGGDCERAPETIALRASNESLNIGDLVCVDFAVDNYVDIRDMSFVMGWIQNILQFSQIRNPNIPGLTAMEPDFTLADAGSLRVTYSSTTAQTLANNTIIFQACFSVLDCTTGVSSALNIGSDNIVPLLFTRSDGASVPVTITDALLTGQDCEREVARIDLVSLTDPSCPGNSDGAILVDVVNLIGSLSCTWVDGNGDFVTNDCNLLLQMAGSYTLTVTDEINNSVMESFTLIDPSAIDILGVDTICFSNGNTDGEIDINFTGGAGGHSITQTDVGTIDGTSIFNIGQGVVTFTAQDAEGCESTFSFNFDGCEDDVNPPGVLITGCDEVSTIISPNGDGTNENFIIGCLNDPVNAATINDLAIYNRWGELVFNADNYNNSWNGTDTNGEELDEGGYMWVFIIGPPTQRQIFRGTLTLLR